MTISTKERLSLIFIAFLVAVAAGVHVYQFFQRPAPKTEPNPAPVAATSTISTDTPLVVDQPVANGQFSAPFAVTGRAQGNWFFEGVFPLKIVDGQDKVLASGQAQAQMDWTTDAMVPFVGFLTFSPGETPASGTAVFLVLSKDNPSGLPEHDASTSIPVIIN